MARIHRLASRGSIIRLAIYAACCIVPVLFLSCATHVNINSGANPPIIRVRLLDQLTEVTLSASEPPKYRIGSDPTVRILGLPKNTPVVVALTPAGWRVGGTMIGSGTLLIQPATEGSVTVNKLPYRGQYRLVPQGVGKFDLVNDVDIDRYLAGVLAKECFPGWHEETYKAQAIVARTYALYEKATAGANRHYDLLPDVRSQVYGGMAGETDKSRRAVNDTIGVVVTYAANGEKPQIFKTYFSSCCGGITQSAADAFRDPFIEPLSEQNNHALCNASPKFNWGPAVIGKEELTRRFRGWGAKHNRPEREIASITAVGIQAVNSWGRPIRFEVTDARQNHYSLGAEEFRNACNYSAPTGDKNAPLSTLYSSFVRVITDADKIRFVEGHGWGHGVGMCQWCSEQRAEAGMKCEDIVLTAFQRAELGHAY